MTVGSMCRRDTVGSVGILNRRTLPFVGANNTIRVFRQALSLDEVCKTKHTYPPLAIWRSRAFMGCIGV